MPRYLYSCFNGCSIREATRAIKDRDYAPECPVCECPMLRVITPPHLHGSPNMPNG